MAGNITIIEPRDNFQKVAKDIIFNEGIDVLTLGVYVKVLCLGKKWKLNVRGLATKLGISADKVRASLAALEKTGYLKRTRAHDKNGKFCGWDYLIGSEPFTDMAKIPTSAESDDGRKSMSEKVEDIDRDVRFQDEDSLSKEEKEKFSPPSQSEVMEYVRSRGWKDPEGFTDFYLAYHRKSGWRKKDGRPINDWKCNIRSWEPYDKDRVFFHPKSFKEPSVILHQMSDDEFMNKIIQ